MNIRVIKSDGTVYEGKYYNKDNSYIFIKVGDEIIMIQWDDIEYLYKVNKKTLKEINVSSFKKGRDQV